jgi:DNA-binding transcriptional MerR regulator
VSSVETFERGGPGPVDPAGAPEDADAVLAVPEDGASGNDARGGGKALTIGAVCKALSQEFPDISISKIRYLEDQKLLQPRRTPGGYRLYSANDVSRLRTILRLQRDEFLPLRVIRQELAAGRTAEEVAQPGGPATGVGPAPAGDPARPGAALRRLTFSIQQRGALYSLEDVCEETGAEARLVAELEDYGLIRGEPRQGTKFYDETEREIVRAVAELSRYGVAGRNLRVFKTSAEREAALLQQILAPALRSRNPERRKEAIEALENLAAVASHLKHLLLVRDLRRIAR